MSFILLGILNSQAAGGFDPASLDPDVWLDASDASTITESGGSVSQWSNKGSKPDFSQGTSADQPTTGVATLNGLNIIDFNDEFLSGGGATSDWKFLSDGTEYFVCGVFKNQGSSRGTLISTSDAATAAIGMNIRFESNNEFLDLIISAFDSIAVEVEVTPDRNYNVYSVITDPDNATAADRAFMFKNDIQSPSTNSSTGTPSTSNPDGVLNIGATGADEDDRLDGQIAELVIVSGANATETNRQKVVEYLNAKWSVF